MKFNPKKTAFGRHETFALRFGWLPKGFRALINHKGDKDLFTQEYATVELGVGKNMVSSIRYWLRACQLVDAEQPTPTPLGTLIFGKEGFDPFLEDEATIWLIHWLLATNAELATSWYWFFNRFHKPEFTSEELATALIDFTKEHIIDGKKPSVSTLKNDAQLLHRMYTQSKGNTRMALEDALDSPLSLLRLVSQSSGGRRYISRPEARPSLPLAVLGFAVAQIFLDRNVKSLPIEELMYSRDGYSAPGAVFRMTETDLITKLEKLINHIPGTFAIRDTAGIHNLFLLKDDLNPLDLLEQHYSESLQEGEV